LGEGSDTAPVLRKVCLLEQGTEDGNFGAEGRMLKRWGGARLINRVSC